MDPIRQLGFNPGNGARGADETPFVQYLNLKLAAMGCPTWKGGPDKAFLEIARPLLAIHHEKNRRLGHVFCPADHRVQEWLDAYLSDVAAPGTARLPDNTLMLDRHGLARAMSLPPDKDVFTSDLLNSYRVRQGILHNPKKDRRTTAGVFHVVEGGLPIPDDKKAVPKLAFTRLLQAAVRPPEDLLVCPFTSAQEAKARLFVSLLLRPLVCPEVRGFSSEKTMEVRFFAPGGLVCNLDFVESIFGNAGNPWLPENDAALDPDHWTGHTGCVILAPHLTGLRKKDLGLPSWDAADARRRRDGMCWKSEDELYNDGEAFKVTARDAKGVMVTLIADNYFGYCKKEVKTQISFSANLYGLAEEEHSGGAVAFAGYDLGEEFHLERRLPKNGATLAEAVRACPSVMEPRLEGYAVDRKYPDIIYVPEDARFSLPEESVSWVRDGKTEKLRLRAGFVYVLPSGYKVSLRKQSEGWHLVGVTGEGTLCHKPCTVSGGGKSEISKSIMDAMVQGPLFTADFQKDMDAAVAVVYRTYGDQFKDPSRNGEAACRPILAESRSLGSVIKLLTPSPDYTDAYNAWLKSIAPHVREIVFVVKRFYKPDWGESWRERFSVDVINGLPGHELKFNDRKIISSYIRVGRDPDGSWRVYKARQDFFPAEKLQVADDITASVVVPSSKIRGLSAACDAPSVKFVRNVEFRLFQRPDDCVHRGYDKQAESDISGPRVFLSNFEPLDREAARDLVDDAVGFDLWTDPVKRLLGDFVAGNDRPGFVVSPAHPRMVDGAPSKNPRYLQDRPDVVDPRAAHLAETGARLFRRLSCRDAVPLPVNSVLAGRRNSSANRAIGLPPLAVYGPVHYQELPELFMDFICSLTGKSPSTTGFGTEGALTKGPFNALLPVIDLNNALLSYILTGHDGFTSSAGYVGPKFRVDHDISLLVPEVWCRMYPEEKTPAFLIREGCLERVEDFKDDAGTVPASRLGWRITRKFVRLYLGRVFSNPDVVFTDEMLRPELQDREAFAEGVRAVADAQSRVAKHYFEDGSVNAACPPLKALLHIMAHGHWEGKDVSHPDVRRLFDRDAVMSSAWYRARLETFRDRQVALWGRHTVSLEEALKAHPEEFSDDDASSSSLGLRGRLFRARLELSLVSAPEFVDSIVGTLGADPAVG